MADALIDVVTAPVTEDLDFSLDETLPVAAHSAADDFDFDLGDGETNADVVEEHLAPAETSAEISADISLDIDEIGYEEEGDGAAEENGTAAVATDAAEIDFAEATEAAKDATETDFAEATETAKDAIETDFAETTQAPEDAGSVEVVQVTEAVDLDIDVRGEHAATEEEAQVEEPHQDIDFSFEDAGDDAGNDEHSEHNDESMAYEAHDHDRGDELAGDEHEDHGPEETQGDESGEEEDVDMSHIHAVAMEQDDFDDSGQDYDEDAENNSDNQYRASPYGSLNSGIGRLQAFDPASNVDVVVTWGDDVCPLFKTPDAEDPDSFYLEDRDALEYPLSQFLQAIRNKISAYIVTSDEIYIRVESLGLEFGETTTEALLAQVTFHNLLALHTMLVKNEDEESSEIQGVHITLGTRPNCLLRLKDLVSGAGQGMGLSDLQTAQHDQDNSSMGSFEGEVELDVEVEVTDEDDEDGENDNENGAEEGDDIEGDDNEEDDEEGAEVDMAGDDSSDSQQDVESSAHDQDLDQDHELDQEQESPNADDDEIEDGVNEVEFAAYNHDDGDDEEHDNGSEEAVGGLLLAAQSTVPDMPAAQADDLAEEAPYGTGSDFLADDADDLVQHSELDLLEDINDAGDLAGETEEDVLQQAADTPALANDDDDFLDLGGDIGELADGDLAVDTLVTGDASNVSGEEADASLDTSATATLDDDEIDYEDNNGESVIDNDNDNDQGGVSLDVEGGDEIDWDDELKNVSSLNDDSLALVTSTTVSAKRPREAEEFGDGVLLDGEPDSKRHRADSPSV